MKKFGILLMVAVLATSFAACNETTEPDPEPTFSISDGSIVETDESIPEPAVIEPEASQTPVGEMELVDPLMVSDAARYRGTVTAIDIVDGQKIITLEQADGRAYGSNSLDFIIPEHTRYNFNPDKLAIGHYLEIYFGYYNITEGPMSADAITVNYIAPSADMVVFNGTVKEVVFEEGEHKSGYLVMNALETNEEFRFNFSEADGTQIYTDTAEIKEGSVLNILHSMATTNSLPPQSYAQEINLYQDINE